MTTPAVDVVLMGAGDMAGGGVVDFCSPLSPLLASPPLSSPLLSSPLLASHHLSSPLLSPLPSAQDGCEGGGGEVGSGRECRGGDHGDSDVSSERCADVQRVNGRVGEWVSGWLGGRASAEWVSG